MPVVLHGDAAFSGQGIVPEVMEVCYRLSTMSLMKMRKKSEEEG